MSVSRTRPGSAARPARVAPPGPAGRLARIRDGLTPGEWTRVGAMAAIVVGLNVRRLGDAGRRRRRPLPLQQGEIFGVGTGILAYTLGMRHAFDADHIAAIDNTTRKLVSEGKRPLSVGLLLLPRAFDAWCSPWRCC